jgi:hypothetical protein
MTTELMERTEIGHASVPFLQRVKILDTYAPTGVADTEEPRVEAIATISAGFRAAPQGGRAGLPQRSADGSIFLHDPEGHAPGLKAELARSNNKRLTIALPGNDLSRCIQQRFSAYSATKLLAYGDETGITEIRGDATSAQHILHAAGSEGFERLLKTCKVSVSLYFNLARWTDAGPVITMPDGLGFYRLRFTSRNSLRSIVNYLEQNVAPLTGGRLAGLPLDLWINQREVAAPDGTRRKVPVFELRLIPPKTIEFNSRTFRNIAIQALNEASAMSLEPPRENVMLALNEAKDMGPDEDLDEASVAAIVSRAPRCDAEHWRAHWFAMVKDTVLEGDDARHEFLGYDFGIDSLTRLLEEATDEEAQGIINAAQDYINEHPVVVAPPLPPPRMDDLLAPPVSRAATPDRVKVYNGLRNRATKMGIRMGSGEEYPVMSTNNNATVVESGIAKLTEKVAARVAEIKADKPAPKPKGPTFHDAVTDRMAPSDPDGEAVFDQEDPPEAQEPACEAQEQPIEATGGKSAPGPVSATMRPISQAQHERLVEITASIGLSTNTDAEDGRMSATNKLLIANQFDTVHSWLAIPKAAFEAVAEGLQSGTLTWGGDS